MPDPKNDIKPVGELKPLVQNNDVRPIGTLRPLNSDVSPDQTQDAYYQAIGQRPDPISQKIESGISKATNDRKITQVWGNEEPGYGKELWESLAKGSAKVGSMTARTPGFIADLALQANDVVSNMLYNGEGLTAVPLDPANKLGISQHHTTDELKTKIKNYLNKFPIGIIGSNLIDVPDKIAKYYDADVLAYQQKQNEKYDQGISDYFSNGEYKKGFKLLGNSIAETVPVSLGLLLGSASGLSEAELIAGSTPVFAADKKAELDKEAPHLDNDTKMNIALANGLFEGIFEQFGITKLGGAVKQTLLENGKEAAEKIAKEGFKDVYAPVVKKYLGTAAEEGISEAATQFAQNAVDKYSGYKPDLELKDGVVDAAIIGMGAGSAFSAGPSILETNKTKKENKLAKEIQNDHVQKDKERSLHAFEIAIQGEEAIRTFKENLQSQVADGKLTKEQADAAITRVNSYKEYEDISGALNLNPEKKLEVFDKTYQKQNLETEIRAMGDPKQMNPLKQAEHHVKEKLANDLQKDINEIVLNAQIKNETTVGNKTLEDIQKKEEKENVTPKPLRPGQQKPIVNPTLDALKEKHPGKIKPEDTRSFDEIPNHEYNDSKFNARVKHKITSEKLNSVPDKTIYGTLIERPFTWDGKGNNVFGIELPGGKKIRFASSMMREEGGFRGHFREERFEDYPVGTPIGIKLYEISPNEEGDAPKKVIKAFRQDNGKFIGWMKETNTGSSTPTEEQADELEHLQTINELPPQNTEINPPEPPAKPIVPEQTNGRIKLSDIKNPPLKTKPINIFEINNPPLKENVKTENKKEKIAILADNGSEKNTTNRKKSSAGNNNKTSEGVHANSSEKTITLRTGTKKANRKIKDPIIRMALRHEVFTPYDIVLQRFIEGQNINVDSLKSFFKNKSKRGFDLTEVNKRISYRPGNSPTSEEIADNLWENNKELNYDSSDWLNAVEDVIRNFHSPKAMAIDINRRYENLNREDFSSPDLEMSDAFDNIDNERIKYDVENLIDAVESLSDKEIIHLANSTNQEKEKWEDEQDIIQDDGEEPFFQKTAVAATSEQIQEVVDIIKKNFPKVDIVYDPNIDAAGQIKGNTLSINPYRAGIDTPIHEAAHVFLDAMHENAIYKKGVDQLRDSDLWHEISEEYPELDEKALANEVFATAIGREGEGVFKEASRQNKFLRILDELFDWLKLHLGLEKNIAKNLAKQIIRGNRTKNLTGENKTVKKSKINKRDFEYYREKHLGINVEKEIENVEFTKSILDDPEVSDEDRQNAKQIYDELIKQRENDKKGYKEFKKETEKIRQINMASSLEGYTLDDLIEAYTNAKYYSDTIDKTLVSETMEKIAFYLNQEGKERLSEHKNFDVNKANTKDLTFKEVWAKTLSHMSEAFPELQEMSKVYDEQYLKMQQERSLKKKELEKLAKKVISEKNKTLGLKEKIGSLFTSDSAKYFNFMEKEGKFASTLGLTKSQKEFRDFVKDLVKDRQLVDEQGELAENAEDDIIKIDTGFMETYRNEGLLYAFSTLFKGLKQDSKSPYGLNYNGLLTNKFNKQHPIDKPYSKDYYRATQLFIDDYTHVKYMNKMVPILDAVSYLNKKGFGEQLAKPNVVKFLQEWGQEHLYQAPKSNGTIMDFALKNLRLFNSMVVMGFNIPASIMNAFVGNYNNWRKASGFGLEEGYVGNKRLLTKKGQTILDHYHVINSDLDSNPKLFAGKLFDMLAYGAQRYGEMQIQGSMFLSKLTKEEWDSFEIKDGELVIKDNEKKLAASFNNYKNQISDIQGKYSEKDRRNYMRGEWGKLISQFKTWMPDAFKERFGEEYIDRNNITHRGSFNMFTKQALQDLKEDWSNDGIKGVLKNKQVAQNLKGALFIAALLTWKYSGDDEDKKMKHKVISLDNAIGNLLFIFDPEQLQYTVTNPVAAQSTVIGFIKVFKDVIKMDEKNLKKDVYKITPYKKIVKPLIEEKAEDYPEKILLGQ